MRIAQAAEKAATDKAAADKAAADKAAAKVVDNTISSMPSIANLELSDKATVTAARTSYTALTSNQQSLVTKLSVLAAAEGQIASLQAEADEAATQKAAASEGYNFEFVKVELGNDVLGGREVYPAFPRTPNEDSTLTASKAA